jgi:hypothetical protein
LESLGWRLSLGELLEPTDPANDVKRQEELTPERQ